MEISWRDVSSLRADLEAGSLTDQELVDFLSLYGTHYAYAVTYGAQGAATYRLSEQQVSQLVAQDVNYSQAWEANAKVTVMGSGGSLGGGTTNARDQKMQNEFASIVQDSEENYTCSGGASCNGGVPSGEPNVPVFLDLRPISELLGPPFYDDPTIVLDLRDRLYDEIQKYAFVKLPPEKPRSGIVELTFQTPECRSEGGGQISWNWSPFNISAGAGSTLIPRANMHVSASDPSAFTLDFANGAPTATLVPSGDTASLGGSAKYDFFVRYPGVGGQRAQDAAPLAFASHPFPSQSGQTVELIANQIGGFWCRQMYSAVAGHRGARRPWQASPHPVTLSHTNDGPIANEKDPFAQSRPSRLRGCADAAAPGRRRRPA